MSNTVYIDCPRCSGRGEGNWHPDQGICYRCRGNGEVRINIKGHMAALRFLRVKFVALREEARKGSKEAAERLVYVVQDGLRLRRDLEAAGVEVH